ncbi:hypothetical protein FRC20_007650 [Serendipita sp. 405]|nr:hypothetical protein FRC20_007650 [Serendipita sp. 405]
MFDALAKSQFDREKSSTAEVDGAKFDGVLEQKKRLVVLRLDDFFKAVFPNVVLTPEEEKRMNKNKQCLSYINLKEIKAEPGLSAQVVKGINHCCPPASNDWEFRYFDTHKTKGKRSQPQPGVYIQQAPDGIVTWMWKNGDNANGDDDPYRQFDTYIKVRRRFKKAQKRLLTPVSQNPGIVFEHKLQSNDDVDLKAGQTGNLTKAQAELWIQKYAYDMSQWTYCEPYRYLVGVTLTGECMRFWVSGPSGTVSASEDFNYGSDARPLFKLLHLYKKSNWGYDVGSDMTFQSIHPSKVDLVNKYCDKIAGAYASESKGGEWLDDWRRRLKERPEGAAWLFDVKQHTKWRPEATAVQPSQSNEVSSEHIAKEPLNQVVVLSVPIFHSTRMTSRGTRCYLVFDWTLVSGTPFDLLDNELDIMKRVHTLKTSWVPPSRDPEYTFYQKVAERRDNTDGNIETMYLGTLLAGGCIDSSVQDYAYARTTARDKGTGSDQDTTSEYGRRLNWLLMKEVGRPLGTFVDGKEFLQVILDVAITLNTLFEVGILHRDVSVNNVLIDIATSRGLLIDMDLAKDLKNKRHKSRPAITGTDNFISLVFDCDRFPLHTLWHDLESLYWTSLYTCIRHKPESHVRFDKKVSLVDEEVRDRCLETIFPAGRFGFLQYGEFLSQDPALDFYLSSMQDVLRSIYSLMALVTNYIKYLRAALHNLLNTCSSSEMMEISNILPKVNSYEGRYLPQQHTRKSFNGHVDELLEWGRHLESMPLDNFTSKQT